MCLEARKNWSEATFAPRSAHASRDLIQQTNTLCEVLRTLVSSMKADTMEISDKSMQMLQERMDRKKK